MWCPYNILLDPILKSSKDFCINIEVLTLMHINLNKINFIEHELVSHSVMSDSLQPSGL